MGYEHEEGVDEKTISFCRNKCSLLLYGAKIETL